MSVVQLLQKPQERIKAEGIKRGFFVEMDHKEASLQTPEAKFLLISLPKNIREKFIDAFMYLGMSSPYVDEVRKYFTDNSLIAKAVYREPGSAEAFDYLYHEKSISSPIDQYFLRCKAGAQIYQRLQALRENLPKIIREEISRNGYKEFLVDNIGSGQGYDMIYILKDNPNLRKYVHIRNIDYDRRALETGKALAKKFGLLDNFSFVCKQVAQVSKRNAHMVLGIGYLCPLPMDICKILIYSWRSYVQKNGLIIYSVISDRMLLEDPVTDFIMTFLRWTMNYKPAYLIDDLALCTRGLSMVNRFYDQPYRYHPMTVLRRSEK